MTRKTSSDRLRVVWDSCVWIDFFQQHADTYQHLKAIAEAGEEGKLVIVSSSIALAEVSRVEGSTRPDITDLATIRLYFANEHVRVEAAHLEICELAQDIQLVGRRNSCTVKPLDAIHIATAAFTNTETFLTLEGNPKNSKVAERHKKLLRMDGLVQRIDGSGPVRIRTPRAWVAETGVGQTKFA